VRKNKYLILSLILGFLLTAFVFFALGFKFGKRGFMYQGNMYKMMGYRRSSMKGEKVGKRWDRGMGNACNNFSVRGKIISIESNSIIVLDDNDVERIIKTNYTKNISGLHKLSELKVNDNIFVLGNPNTNGVFQADFIRKSKK